MKRFTVLLMVAVLTMVGLVPAGAFAYTGTYRAQATAGMFDDDPADDITNGVYVVRLHPKWSLMTRFSNLLNSAAGGDYDSTSEDKILDYGGGSANGSTFYALVGSSEWFETNLGLPVNFAFSYERDGARHDMLDEDADPGYSGDDPVAWKTYSSDGDGFTGGSGNALEHTNRRASADYKNNEWNLSAGYKINDSLSAGLNWNHQGAKIRHINDGETEDKTSNIKYTYATGLDKDVLTSAQEDTFNGVVHHIMSDDIEFEGYATLGWYLSKDNRATFETNTSSPNGTASIAGAPSLPVGASDVAAAWSGGLTVNRLPQQLETSTAGGDTEQNLEVTSKANGLIFSFSGIVYYFPLYKGNINSELGYEYRGGSISKTETLSDGTNDEVYTVSGKQSNHTLLWGTERFINLEGIDVGLAMVWTRSSTTTNATVDWESDVGSVDGSLTINSKSVTHTWEFPIGAELSVKENWTVRAGMEHSVALATSTLNTKADDDVGDYDKTTVTKSDSRSTAYKYGVGYAWSENLQLDLNAFLEEVNVAGAIDRADIFDLATYRNLAISATLTF